MKRVTAILCHHKGTELILRSIKSLKQSKFVDLDIIVATSVENAAFHGTRTIYVRGGPAYKRNVAFRFTDSEYIAFFDDDIEATPTAISGGWN